MAKIGVVGAGMMGSEIALVFALGGHEVRLLDREPTLIDAAVRKLATLVEKGIERKLFEPAAREALSRLIPAVAVTELAESDIVIEAVIEDEAVKAGVYATLFPVLREDAIIASNTSSISITSLAGSLPEARRRRFLGTHFFSPVSRMRLVEVIPGLDTDAGVVDAMLGILSAIGKTPIRVKDVVGFAVNRILHIFWIEATRLVEEGVASPRDIDLACKLALGHPVGPFELMDGVTNNLTLDVQEILHAHYGDRFLPRPMLKALVKAGYNGRKSGRGWYRYRDGVRVE